MKDKAVRVVAQDFDVIENTTVYRLMRDHGWTFLEARSVVKSMDKSTLFTGFKKAIGVSEQISVMLWDFSPKVKVVTHDGYKCSICGEYRSKVDENAVHHVKTHAGFFEEFIEFWGTPGVLFASLLEVTSRSNNSVTEPPKEVELKPICPLASK